jgi:hypothetical protein
MRLTHILTLFPKTSKKKLISQVGLEGEALRDNALAVAGTLHSPEHAAPPKILVRGCRESKFRGFFLGVSFKGFSASRGRWGGFRRTGRHHSPEHAAPPK